MTPARLIGVRGGRRPAFVVGGALLVLLGLVLDPVAASPPAQQGGIEQAYHGGYFGENNFPPGCTRDSSDSNPDNICYRMKSLAALNPLDSPQIDVLILVPVTATSERDMRIMRQAVEMWEGGIHYLAPQMGLDWLLDVNFHITIDAVDLSGNDGGEFTTYPVVDPEIVVIGALNPGAGAGAGLDVLSLVNAEGVPCHDVANPFDIETWEALPGFDSHHESRGGTYVEDCGGRGGNVCFSVNSPWDVEPTMIDWFDLFWLVSHEFGHCLTLGHVGDGSESVLLGYPWGPVPFDEIMSYTDDARFYFGGAPALNRCASTLDVEVFATRLSHFLDVNGDGAVTDEDVLEVNDQIGIDDTTGTTAMQVQHPDDYLFASSTGLAADCPQPDLGLVPGPRTDWTPDPAPIVEMVLEITGPVEGATTSASELVITGTVSERSLMAQPAPTSTSVTHDDDPADATSPFTEIASLTVSATDTTVEAVLDVGQLSPARVGPNVYSLIVDGKRFDSYLKADADQPVLNDGWETIPGGTEWDLENGRVLFHIPREFLRTDAIYAPYELSAVASFGANGLYTVRDDWAPEPGASLDIAAPPERLPEPVENPAEDDDIDGVPDAADRCPGQPGLTADGCTAVRPSRIEVSVDGVLAGTQDVVAAYGPAGFAIPVELLDGQHTIHVAWRDGEAVLASQDIAVNRQPAGD